MTRPEAEAAIAWHLDAAQDLIDQLDALDGDPEAEAETTEDDGSAEPREIAA